MPIEPCGTALRLTRNGDGSTIEAWDISQDCITEHDRRHLQLRDYTVRQTPNDRQVASAIRPLLEAFFRVACPAHFPPEALLGPFHRLCLQRVSTPQQILDNDDTRNSATLSNMVTNFITTRTLRGNMRVLTTPSFWVSSNVH